MVEKISKIVIVGSGNIDFFFGVDRLPAKGETVSSTSFSIKSGGKGANQAAECALLGTKATFIAQVGNDAYVNMLEDDLKSRGVDTSKMTKLADNVCGQAYIFLYPDGDNSILTVGGANVAWDKTSPLSPEQIEAIKNCDVLLLQREIPEFVNVVAAKIAKENKKIVILDLGGIDVPLTKELLANVDVISPNETELARVAECKIAPGIEGMIETCKQVQKKAPHINFLLKLGSKGSMYINTKGEATQAGVFSDKSMPILDTTGAGDCFTAAFTSQFILSKPIEECLRFASAAAYLCIIVKGALPSMPKLSQVKAFLETHPHPLH